MAFHKENSTEIDPALLEGESPFRNSLLIAMPGLSDGMFTRSVIYVCAHSSAGAMGIVINQKLPDIGFSDLMSQLGLKKATLISEPIVHFGGPVETGRGFVLHSTDYTHEDTVRINEGLCITGTIDILDAIAAGKGPHRSIFALGYAGWGPGQLEKEIEENAWMTAPASEDILFSTAIAGKWERAMASIGINTMMLSEEAGHA